MISFQLVPRPLLPAFDRLAGWIIADAEKTPYFHLQGYMRRFWSIRQRKRLRRWFNGARVHNTLRSDIERAHHDHPWPSMTLVLRGGCFEVVPADQHQSPAADKDPRYVRRIWRGPGSIVIRRARDRHRLEIPEGQTCWTWFAMGPAAKATPREQVRIVNAFDKAWDEEKIDLPIVGLPIYRGWFFHDDDGPVFWRSYLDDWATQTASDQLFCEG